MPKTSENQKKAQEKYLANPENRAKKNAWNREYLKTHVYIRSDEQKERHRKASLARYHKNQEKLKQCEELLKYDEIKKFMERLKEKECETVQKCETAEPPF